MIIPTRKQSNRYTLPLIFEKNLSPKKAMAFHDKLWALVCSSSSGSSSSTHNNSKYFPIRAKKTKQTSHLQYRNLEKLQWMNLELSLLKRANSRRKIINNSESLKINLMLFLKTSKRIN